jgi:CPA1 family monovalent cation:H+ antiporter
VTLTLLAVRGAGLAAAVVVPRLRPRRAPDGDDRRTWRSAAVVTWAGARGVIPLAAALSIPLTTDAGRPFPHRPLLLVVATGAVVITLVAQGTTLEPLVRRLGVVGDPQRVAAEHDHARRALAAAALARLDDLAGATQAPRPVVDRVRDELRQRVDTDSAGDDDGGWTARSYDALRRRLLTVEADELARLRVAGEISVEVFRDIQHRLDLDAARLRE